MKDGHGEASDSKYRIVPSGSGSCLYVKGKKTCIDPYPGEPIAIILSYDYKSYLSLIFIEIPSTTSTTPTPTTTAEATTAGASGTKCDAYMKVTVIVLILF